MIKKSFNPLRMWSSYVWGFLFAATYISLLITANITFGVIDDQIAGCLTSCENFPIEGLELCQEQCNAVREITQNRFLTFLENFQDVPTANIILWVAGLFILGFLFGWGIGSLKRVIER